MDNGTIAILISGGLLFLNIVLALKSGAWGLSDRLSQMEARIMGSVSTHRGTIDSEIEVVRRECVGIRGDLRDMIDQSERRFGETVEALRKHVQQVEIYIRDEYVRRDSFLAYIHETREVVRLNADRIDSRLERMEEKLDAAKMAAARRAGEE